MSNYYKIEDKNEFAFFRANLDQIRQHLNTDPRWAGRIQEQLGFAGGFMEQLHDPRGINLTAEKLRVAKLGSTVIDEGNNYFVVRGLYDLYFRIEAIDGNKSKIIPQGGMSSSEKFSIISGLLLNCIIPVVVAPLVLWVKKNLKKANAQQHLEAFCKYLEMRQREIDGQIRGEVAR